MSNPNTNYSKFLSLSNFKFVEDILERKNAYFSKGESLNDPLETLNCKTLAIDNWQLFDDVETLDGITRSFCLSRPKDIGAISLMWAHYGDSFSGIRVELELEYGSSYKSLDVRYKPIGEIRSILDQSNNHKYAVDEIFKADWWSYENEIRFVSTNWPDEEHYYVPLKKLGLVIRAVYFTERTQHHRNYEKLVKSCAKQNISLIHWDYLSEIDRVVRSDR